MDRLADVAVIVGVTILAVTTLWSGKPVDVPQPGYTLPAINGVRFGEAERTLLLFISTRCRPCNDSVPFYRVLIKAANRAATTTQVVLMSREPPDRVRHYAEQNQLVPHSVVSIAGDTLKELRGTPTVLLVRNTGTVEKVWVGRLRPGEQIDLLRTIGVSPSP